MTETPQHPSQDPYGVRPRSQQQPAAAQQPQYASSGQPAPQPSSGQPPYGQPAHGAPAVHPQGFGQPAPRPYEDPAVVTAQTGEYTWGGGQVPPGGLPPVPPELALGPQPPRRRARKVGLSMAVAVAVFAAAIGGVSGAYFDHHFDANDAASSVSVVTGSNSSDTTTTVGAVAKTVLPSVVKITETTNSAQGIGSGMVVSADGYIVTNNHVVADYVSSGGTLTVTDYSGKTYNAKVVGYIAADDIAVIQVEGGSNWKPVTFADSSNVQVGDETVAIGSPDDLQNTVTSGIVSALNRQVSVTESSTQGTGNGSGGFPGFNWGTSETTVTYTAIQTDASINPGNSGGPLLNSSGQVIGMNSAIYSTSSSSSSSSQSGSVGLGFAIPSNKIVTDVKKIEAGQGDSTSSSGSSSGTNSNSGTY